MLVRLANCCQPIPGDTIMGYITRGQGVTIHRRRLPLPGQHRVFPPDPGGVGRRRRAGKLYPVKIQVVTVDKPGLLADITSALKSADVNVTKASVETQDNKGIAKFTIQVGDQQHLEKVFGSLKRLKEVISVRRLTG